MSKNLKRITSGKNTLKSSKLQNLRLDKDKSSEKILNEFKLFWLKVNRIFRDNPIPKVEIFESCVVGEIGRTLQSLPFQTKTLKVAVNS